MANTYPQVLNVYPQVPQYQATTNTYPINVVTTQVQGSAPTLLPIGNRGWSTEFCDICGDGKICCCVFFCAPFYACYMSQRLGESCCVPIVAGTIPLRLKIRMMLGIRGTICDDCCSLTWQCTAPCALCQMAREMKAIGLLE